VFTLLTTWKRGRELLARRLADDTMELASFLAAIAGNGPQRVPGTAVFLTTTPDNVPHALLHSLKHYKVLHEQVVILSVRVSEVPFVAAEERVTVRRLAGDFSQVIVHYGFKDEPDIPQALALCAGQGLNIEMMETSFFLGRETLIPKFGSGMAYWRALLFVALFRNASSAMAFFRIPSNRVIELGSQVVL